jgi:hypothetical protein
MSLSGKSLCFTGMLTVPRASCAAQAQAAGAAITGGVTGKTTHLVTGPGAGSKVAAAQAKGVVVWTEAEFFSALGGASGASSSAGGSAAAPKGKRAAAEALDTAPKGKAAKKPAAPLRGAEVLLKAAKEPAAPKKKAFVSVFEPSLAFPLRPLAPAVPLSPITLNCWRLVDRGSG